MILCGVNFIYVLDIGSQSEIQVRLYIILADSDSLL